MEEKSGKLMLFERIILFAVMLVVFINSFFIFQKKEGFFLDEACTFMLSNNTVVTTPEIIEVVTEETTLEGLYHTAYGRAYSINAWVSHEDIMNKYTVSPEDRFSYLNTYLLQANDVHPPLYYMIIRTVCAIFPSLDLMIVGYVVNIIFLLGTCYFLYKLGKIIFGGNIIGAIIAVMYYGLSFDFANNVTYYRMYAALTFWFVFLLYHTIIWAGDGYEDDKKTIKKLCVIEALAMLTQYFAVFFILPMFVLNIFFMVYKKKEIGRYIKYNVITGVIYIVVWPFSIFHILFTNRGSEVRANFSALSLFRRIDEFNSCLIPSVFSNSRRFFIAFGVITIVLIIYKCIRHCMVDNDIRKWVTSTHFMNMIYLFVVAVSYYVIAAVASPWVTPRYEMPVMPLFSLIIVFILIRMITIVIQNKYVIGTIMAAFIVMLTVHWQDKIQPTALYNSSERVKYINDYTKYDAILIDSSGCYTEVELNFNHPKLYETDNENYDNLDTVVDSDKSYILYISKDNYMEGILKNLESKGFNMQKLDFEADYFKVYILSKSSASNNTY
ncbi:MAG: hypothetical protein IJR96_01045 [Pseudobutyrivibrio sp.]|nr:hypothetical protein [Pseudobutyrivibrio sp.]